MKLRELEATFVGKATANSFNEQDTIDGAQGIMFDCPLCHRHSVLCWFSNPINAPIVPADMEPGPGRWEASGSSIDDLTLNPSVNLDTQNAREHKSCLWHGWVKNGNAN